MKQPTPEERLKLRFMDGNDDDEEDEDDLEWDSGLEDQE